MANILVVEDEAPLREVLVDHLLDEGHCPVEARNGKEALELYSSSNPDLIISDINMPVMDGFQFLKNLQSNHPEVENIPFFFLSALSDADDQIKGLNYGIDEYLCKPVDFGVLTTRIELSLLRQQKINKKISDAIAASESQPKEPSPSLEEDDSSSNTSEDPSNSSASSIGGLLGSKRLNLSSEQQESIRLTNSPKHFQSASIINNIGRKVNISRLFIRQEKYEMMIDEISSSEFDEQFFLIIIEHFFTSLIYFLDRKNYVRERALIIPSIYEYVLNRKIREIYIKMLDHIQDKYSISIISEIVNVSDKLSTSEDAFMALSRRKQPQIVEITRLDQIKGVSLGTLRLGAVSMNYADAMKLGEEEIVRLRKLLMNSNISFYVKEIPDGKLSSAQMTKADLLSVSS